MPERIVQSCTWSLLDIIWNVHLKTPPYPGSFTWEIYFITRIVQPKNAKRISGDFWQKTKKQRMNKKKIPINFALESNSLLPSSKSFRTHTHHLLWSEWQRIEALKVYVTNAKGIIIDFSDFHSILKNSVLRSVDSCNYRTTII